MEEIMSGFDIDNFLQFQPPKYLCQKCCALNCPPSLSYEEYGKSIVCPVCQVEYIPVVNEYNYWQLEKYLDEEALTSIEFKNPIVHAKALARIVRNIKSKESSYPPIRGLFDLLLAAKQFVHFTSYGISHQFIGALKLLAQRINIRGIVTGVDDATAREIKEFPDEAQNLQIYIFDEKDGARDVPHQKLIVVDGLIAIKGSTNLTLNGWRKAAKGLDLLEIVTNIAEVTKLHNEYFSPLWASTSNFMDIPNFCSGNKIKMSRVHGGITRKELKMLRRVR
jgi:hypothetical protein